MRRIPLPDNGWVELREPADLRVKHKHLMQAAYTGAMVAMNKIPDFVATLPKEPQERAAAIALLDVDDLTAKGALTFDEARSLQRVQEVTVVAFVVAWSLKEPVPNVDTVGDMREEIYDVIAEATQKDAAAALQGVNFDPTPRDESGNPSGPASDSNGHSKAGDESPSTTMLQPSFASISSAD